MVSKRSRKILSMTKPATFVLATSMILSGTSYAAISFDFYKDAYSYYGPNDVLLWDVSLSNWGSVTVKYDNISQPQYFSLSINGSWKVLNMTLSPYAGIGQQSAVSFNFAIDEPVGASIDFGYSISNTPELGGPADAFNATVQAQDAIGSQNQGGIPWTLGIAPALLMGGLRADGGFHERFPNQDCDTMFCSPTSVSNSLQWLNGKYNLKMPADKISIAALAGVFGTTKNGTPLPWWDKKEKYIKDEKLPVYQVVTTSIEEALKAIKAGKDIELNTQPHAAAIVGITKLIDGRYEISVAHDTKQGPSGAGQKGEGGTIIEKGIYDTKTGKITGIKWMDGSALTNFVIEAPVPEPETWLMLVAGFGKLGWRLRSTRRVSFA